MNRYLLKISYIGTAFRGMQKTINKAEAKFIDRGTIQGLLEIGLQKLRPVNEIEVVLSSRTDAGVHALENSVHVDLVKPDGGVYPTTSITSVLNRHFSKNSLQIRVKNTIHVPYSFHCRYNAQGRTYLYRLAVAKEEFSNKNQDRGHGYLSFIPIEEYDRCCFLHNDKFDLEVFENAAQMFVGVHDFRTFMNSNKRNIKQNRPRFSLRAIDSLEVRPGRPCVNTFVAETAEKNYNYWDIEIKARSFVHNQIRRMVGCLISAATGRISKRDVYEMLTIPSKHSWDSRVLVAPAFALYLCKVHYDENDLKFESESETVSSTESNN